MAKMTGEPAHVTVLCNGETHKIPTAVFAALLNSAEHRLSRLSNKTHAESQALRWVLKMQGVESPMRD